MRGRRRPAPRTWSPAASTRRCSTRPRRLRPAPGPDAAPRPQHRQPGRAAHRDDRGARRGAGHRAAGRGRRAGRHDDRAGRRAGRVLAADPGGAPRGRPALAATSTRRSPRRPTAGWSARSPRCTWRRPPLRRDEPAGRGRRRPGACWSPATPSSTPRCRGRRAGCPSRDPDLRPRPGRAGAAGSCWSRRTAASRGATRCDRVLRAVRTCSTGYPDVDVVLPAHPNPAVRAAGARPACAASPGSRSPTRCPTRPCRGCCAEAVPGAHRLGRHPGGGARRSACPRWCCARSPSGWSRCTPAAPCWSAPTAPDRRDGDPAAPRRRHTPGHDRAGNPYGDGPRPAGPQPPSRGCWGWRPSAPSSSTPVSTTDERR